MGFIGLSAIVLITGIVSRVMLIQLSQAAVFRLRICLDGQSVNAQNREWYRQNFSVVFSDFYLFHQLLRFDRPNLDEQAQIYLKWLQLDTTDQQFPYFLSISVTL